MSLNPRPSPEPLSIKKAHVPEHPLRSPGCGVGSTGTQIAQIAHPKEDGPTVDVVLVHGLERATESTWHDRTPWTVFWPRDLIPYKSQPRSGRIMTYGYNANVVPQNRDNAETNQSKMRRVFAILMHIKAHDVAISEHLMDRPPRMLYRRVDGRRDPMQGGGVEKPYQMLSHSWGQPGINSKGNITFTTAYTGEDASYNRQDGVFQNSYQASLRRFIDHHSPIAADPSNCSETMGFPRYRRLCRVLWSFIIPAVTLSYPTTASAAAISWRCTHCSNGIFLLPSHSLVAHGRLTKSIDSTPPGGSTSSNIVLMLPLSPGRHILEYLAICSVASVLIYLQGTGVYLKYSFMACSGLLSLICVSAGTETMLRFLPLVGLLTLLASWVCQMSAKIIRGHSCHEIRDELVATPGCAPMEKNPQLSATRDTFRDR